jgi:hypothetical protein
MPPTAETDSEYPSPVTPPRRLEVTMVSCGGVVTWIVRACVTTCWGAEVSLTCTVKLNGPAAATVPEISPVVALIERPAGSAPALMLKV